MTDLESGQLNTCNLHNSRRVQAYTNTYLFHTYRPVLSDVRLTLRSLRIQRPLCLKPKPLSHQAQGVKYVRSVCPLPRGVQRHQGLQISTVTGYRALPAAQAGSCQARQASGQILRGHLKALPVPWNAICRPSPPRAAALGMQTAHATRCGGTGKSAQSGEGCRGGGREGNRLCLTTGCRAERTAPHWVSVRVRCSIPLC